MAGIFGNLFKGGGLFKQVGSLVDDLTLSGEEKQAFKLNMEKLLQDRDNQIEKTIRSELAAKERVLVAELTQGDTYTKRARPTVVYAGLVFIFLISVLPNIIVAFGGEPYKPINLPPEFWIAWGGIVTTWSVGRSAEKRGIRNKLTDAFTGRLEGRILS